MTLPVNHFHNILRLFDVLLSFAFTTSETIPRFTYKLAVCEFPHELTNDLRLRKFRNLGN